MTDNIIPFRKKPKENTEFSEIIKDVYLNGISDGKTFQINSDTGVKVIIQMSDVDYVKELEQFPEDYDGNDIALNYMLFDVHTLDQAIYISAIDCLIKSITRNVVFMVSTNGYVMYYVIMASNGADAILVEVSYN